MAKIDLAAVVAATVAGSFVYVSEKDAKKPVSDGMIEINLDMRDTNGNVAARATQKGIDSMNTPNTPATASAAPSFEIVTGPKLDKPGRQSASRYPFAELPAPDANGNTAKFFVPATAEKPEPWSSLTSTVSAASREFARVVGTKPGKNKNGEDIQRNIYEFDRKFALIKGEHNGVAGAWVERVK